MSSWRFRRRFSSPSPMGRSTTFVSMVGATDKAANRTGKARVVSFAIWGNTNGYGSAIQCRDDIDAHRRVRARESLERQHRARGWLGLIEELEPQFPERIRSRPGHDVHVRP